MGRRSTWFLGVSVLLVLGLVGSSAWAVPRLINYQGMLTDGAGNPVSNPALSMHFSIYDVQTDGTLLWEESQVVDVQ